MKTVNESGSTLRRSIRDMEMTQIKKYMNLITKKEETKRNFVRTIRNDYIYVT